jgi:hypothetical protein
MIPDEDKPTPTYWINFNAATGEPVGSFVCESELASIPLWADPPIKRKPLSDETLRQCAQAMNAEPLSEGWTELIKFARAIERAHGIKDL